MIKGRAWTGFEAAALQEAMRLPIRKFAALLGVETTTINNPAFGTERGQTPLAYTGDPRHHLRTAHNAAKPGTVQADRCRRRVPMADTALENGLVAGTSRGASGTDSHAGGDDSPGRPSQTQCSAAVRSSQHHRLPDASNLSTDRSARHPRLALATVRRLHRPDVRPSRLRPRDENNCWS